MSNEKNYIDEIAEKVFLKIKNEEQPMLKDNNVSSTQLSTGSPRFRDYSQLPQDMLEELQGKRNDVYTTQVCDLLREGPLDTSQIYVGLYVTYGRKDKRARLAVKLSNMKKAGHIYSVPGKRGCYSLDPIK